MAARPDGGAAGGAARSEATVADGGERYLAAALGEVDGSGQVGGGASDDAGADSACCSTGPASPSSTCCEWWLFLSPQAMLRSHRYGSSSPLFERRPRARSCLLARGRLFSPWVVGLACIFLLAMWHEYQRPIAPHDDNQDTVGSGADVDDAGHVPSARWRAYDTEGTIRYVYMPKYHLLDPSEFRMYARCLNDDPTRFGEDRAIDGHANGVSDGLKHSVDALFLRTLLARNDSVPAIHADIVIVPVLWSQSAHGFCGRHRHNMDDLIEALLRSPTYLGNMGTPHIIIKDVYGSSFNEMGDYLALPGVYFGRFEAQSSSECCTGLHYHLCEGDRTGCFSVGYSTVAAVEDARQSNHTPLPLRGASPGVCLGPDDLAELPVDAESAPPLAERKFRYSTLFSFDSRPSFETRRQMARAVALARNGSKPGNPLSEGLVAVYSYCDGGTNGEHYNHEYYVRPSSKWCADNFPGQHTRVSCKEALQLMRDSAMVVALPGDTPTSDRLWNAFDTLTLIGVLSAHMGELLDVLPFRWAVPWEDILVPINQTEYDYDPILAPLLALDRLGTAGMSARLSLMRKYRDDVSWANKATTRVADHIIEAAWDAVSQQSKFDTGENVLRRRCNTVRADLGYVWEKRVAVQSSIRRKRDRLRLQQKAAALRFKAYGGGGNGSGGGDDGDGGDGGDGGGSAADEQAAGSTA